MKDVGVTGITLLSFISAMGLGGSARPGVAESGAGVSGRPTGGIRNHARRCVTPFESTGSTSLNLRPDLCFSDS
jgi:hypothetical protein